jgi:AraC-like DNA-binding protein
MVLNLYKFIRKHAFLLVIVLLSGAGINSWGFFRFISPEKAALISTNHIIARIETDRSDIGYVRLSAEYVYQDEISLSDRLYARTTDLGSDSVAPYEWVWNCDSIPDQLLRFLAVPYNQAGKPIDELACRTIFVLDRSKDHPEVVMRSVYHGGIIKADGDFADWPLLDSIVMQNNDNRVSLKSVWNNGHLFFAVNVKDKYVVCDTMQYRDSVPCFSFVHGRMDILGKMPFLWNFDDIELCIDLKNNRHYYRDLDDVDIIVSPLNKLVGNVAHLDTSMLSPESYVWHHNVLYQAKKTGTGYLIEIAVPWSDLNMVPENGLVMGFDIVNVDRDGPDRRKVFISWSKTTWLNNDNPTEWGSLVLIKPSPNLALYIMLAVIFASLVLVLVITIIRSRSLKRALREFTDKKHKKPVDPRIQTAIDHIHEHFAENLSIEAVSRFAGLSRSYFSQQFARETGVPFGQYLIFVRIEKSKDLIKAKQMNFSEIAFKVGFKSSQHFSSTFRKIAGMSPGDFRKQS